MRSFFLGIDGGATKTIVRLEDADGQLLAQQTGGPSNIRISVDQAWASINSIVDNIFSSLNLIPDQFEIYTGMGLAGCEIKGAVDAFLSRPHHFKELVITSDAEIACLGAHAGESGAIIIIGTGVVGFQMDGKLISKVGGYGFPHDDLGGGAWLGLEAIKLTFQSVDQRLNSSLLTDKIFQHFSYDLNKMTTWANQSNSSNFAQLAPFVIEAMKAGDEKAIALLQQAALAIEQVSKALSAKQKKPLPCALIGSISSFIQPFLSDDIRTKLIPSKKTPDVGAIYLVQKKLGNFNYG